MPQIPDLAERNLAAQLDHVRLGIWLVVLASASLGVYLWLTPDGPNRAALWAMIAVQFGSGALIPFLPLRRWLGPPRRRMRFYGSWTGLTVVSVFTGALLDGGAASPVVLTFSVSMVFAAVLYPPRGVLLVGAGVQVAVLVLYLCWPPPDDRFMAGLPVLAMANALIAITGCVVARTNQRLLSEEQRLSTRLRELAEIDGLTGCLNHRSFQGRLHEGVRCADATAQPISLLLADIDHFKQVNDEYGHPVGDAVLCTVAEILRATVRKGDVVGRIGGEEFAVLAAGCSDEEALVLAERLRVAISNMTDPAPVTVSVGVCTEHTAPRSAEALLRDVDKALYAAKRAGRNRVVTAPGPGSPRR